MMGGRPVSPPGAMVMVSVGGLLKGRGEPRPPLCGVECGWCRRWGSSVGGLLEGWGSSPRPLCGVECGAGKCECAWRGLMFDVVVDLGR